MPPTEANYRNHIEVGRYIDYVFPAFNVRFIALSDGIDTIDRNSTAMEMMPIVNLFNEWHAASTSKKLRVVKEANAKAGKYRAPTAAYGYTKSDDESRLPVPDEPAASIVRRIFEERAQGITPYRIAERLNSENVLTPSDYHYAKLGKPNPYKSTHLWTPEMIREMVKNPTYLGDMVQLRKTTVSYKNHTVIKKDPSEWVVVENTHEPLVSRETWDKVREVEASVSRGKITKRGITPPLSGLMFCADCGEKMRFSYTLQNKRRKSYYYRYQCGSFSRLGKQYCTSHHIRAETMDELVLADIRSMATLVVNDEAKARAMFLSEKEKQNDKQTKDELKRLKKGKARLSELDILIPATYEDKVLGKIPEGVCAKLLDKYQSEYAELSAEVGEIEAKQNAAKQDERDVEEFIRRVKKYTDVQELTREMCLELIEYITIDEYVADRPRDIHIYYKLLDKPLKDKNRLDNAKMSKPA